MTGMVEVEVFGSGGEVMKRKVFEAQ